MTYIYTVCFKIR